MRYPITTYSTNSFHMKRCENVFAYKNDIVTVLCVSHKTRRITPTNISFHIKRAGLNHSEWPHFECFRKNEKKIHSKYRDGNRIEFFTTNFHLKTVESCWFCVQKYGQYRPFWVHFNEEFRRFFFTLALDPFYDCSRNSNLQCGYEDMRIWVLKNHYAMTHACINKIFHLYFVDAISPTCHMVCTFFVNNLNTMNRLLS